MPTLDLFLLLLFILTSIILVSIFPSQQRWKGLLVSSLMFYSFTAGTDIIYLVLFTAVIYGFGFLIPKYPTKTWMIIGIVLMPLILSKVIFPNFHPGQYAAKTILLGEAASGKILFQIIGISYFTFNAISYLIDIKRNYIKPEANFLFLLLYLIFFPCVFSGPLHRAKYLFGQFRQIHISDQSLSSGLRLILLGTFKNIVIAQRLLAIVQNLIASEISGVYYLLSGLLFFFYLYFNFSSFIDIFQGISKLFGIQLRDNFRNRIYLSYSRQNFWNGWHITLNEWFRDYFFFTLAKKDKKRKYTNTILLCTFLLIAMWHEVSTVFLIWGLMNGMWIILEKKIDLEKLPFPKFRRLLGPVYHLAVASLLALIFTSANITSLVNRLILSPARFPAGFIRANLNNIVVTVVAFLILDYHYARASTLRFDDYLGQKPVFSRWLIYVSFTLLVLAFGITNAIDNYYVQF